MALAACVVVWGAVAMGCGVSVESYRSLAGNVNPHTPPLPPPSDPPPPPLPPSLCSAPPCMYRCMHMLWVLIDPLCAPLLTPDPRCPSLLRPTHPFEPPSPHTEQVVFSDLFQKINRRDKAQDRAILVTTQAVYNLKPSNLGSCKRRILISRIESVTLSEVGLCLWYPDQCCQCHPCPGRVGGVGMLLQAWT
jgi:hypothetical protein